MKTNILLYLFILVTIPCLGISQEDIRVTLHGDNSGKATVKKWKHFVSAQFKDGNESWDPLLSKAEGLMLCQAIREALLKQKLEAAAIAAQKNKPAPLTNPSKVIQVAG